MHHELNCLDRELSGQIETGVEFALGRVAEAEKLAKIVNGELDMLKTTGVDKAYCRVCRKCDFAENLIDVPVHIILASRGQEAHELDYVSSWKIHESCLGDKVKRCTCGEGWEKVSEKKGGKKNA